MNMVQHRSLSLNSIIALVVIGTAIVAIVASALASGTLPVLLAGAAVLLGIVSVFAAFVVRLYVRWSEARLKAIGTQNQHVEAMAKLGYLPSDNRFRPIQAQIAAPAQHPAANPGSQIIFNANALRESSVNLLLFSMRLLGEDSKRIASSPECAAANITGYSARTWDKMINGYLRKRYPDIAAIQGPVSNGGGVYVPDSIGTIKALYDRVMLDSAIDALPGSER